MNLLDKIFKKKQKVKIGIFVDNFFPAIDGVVMVVDNYAKRLQNYCEIVVVAPSYKNEDNNFSYKIIRVKSIKIPGIGYRLAVPLFEKKLKKTLIQENFDLIHIHSPFTLGKLGIKIAKESNIPVVATMHSQFKKEYKRYLKSDIIATKLTKKLMKVYNSCDECWAVNQKIADLFKSYGYQKEPIVMDNATDMTLIEDKIKNNEKVNLQYNLKSNDVVLLFVGRLNLLKNIMFIADVLNVLQKKKFKFKMLFVGKGSDEEILKQKIIDYQLEDKVIFCGEIKDRKLLQNIYARSQLFIFPSLYDASSLVQIEAASQKVPTLFLEGAITASNIIDKVNGYISPNDNVKFANIIIEILNNRQLYSQVSEKVYSDIYKSYDKMVNEVHKKYLYLIKRGQYEKNNS